VAAYRTRHTSITDIKAQTTPFGLLVLEGAALAVHFDQFLRPRLGLLVRVSEHGPEFLFYEQLETGLQKVEIFQKTRDELPHWIFELPGARPEGVRAGVGAVFAAVGVAVIVASLFGLSSPGSDAPPLVASSTFGLDQSIDRSRFSFLEGRVNHKSGIG
jgi:hypothetical protein